MKKNEEAYTFLIILVFKLVCKYFFSEIKRNIIHDIWCYIHIYIEYIYYFENPQKRKPQAPRMYTLVPVTI